MATDTYSGVCLWKRDRLQEYLRDRGLPTSARLDKLRALVFGAQFFDVAPKKTANEVNIESRTVPQITNNQRRRCQRSRYQTRSQIYKLTGLGRPKAFLSGPDAYIVTFPNTSSIAVKKTYAIDS